MRAVKPYIVSKGYNNKRKRILRNISILLIIFAVIIVSASSLPKNYLNELLTKIKSVKRIRNEDYLKNVKTEPSPKLLQLHTNNTDIVTAKSKSDSKMDIVDYYELGNNYRINNQYDNAIDAYTKELAKLTIESQNVTTNNNIHWGITYSDRGLCYYYKGLYSSAIADFTKAIEFLSDTNPSGEYYLRGLSYEKIGKYDNAISDYIKALNSHPYDYLYPVYHNVLGEVYVKKGEYEKAIVRFTKAIELNPKFADAYQNRGHTYLHIGKKTEAERDFSKARELKKK